MYDEDYGRWFESMYEIGEGVNKGYPHELDEKDVEFARNFSSVILGEELEGFDQVGSHYTQDIIETLKALNATKSEPVQIH